MRSVLLCVALLLSACDGGSAADTAADTAAGTDYPPGTCLSDSFWTRGNHESPLMHPGGTCIQCHADSREGPSYVVAGTVYTLLDEPVDCNGLQGVEVEIMDSEGSVWTATTNDAGNFFLSPRQADPVFPITAVVRDGDVEREMVTPQESGECNACHTDEGANGAMGRIVIP